MLAALRSRCTYSNVMATIAVFIAIGGSSYAAIRITGRDVVNRSLTGRDIKKHSLTGANVAYHTLLARNFKAGQLPRGATGPQGDTGPQGPQGLPGTNASLSGVTAGGDLTGTYPSPTIANGVVTAAKVASNSLTGAQIDESTLGTVPDSAELGGLAPSAFEQPKMAQISFGGLQGNALILVGDAQLVATCFNGHPTAPNGASVAVFDTLGTGTMHVWVMRNGATVYADLPGTETLDGSNPGALDSASPQVFVFQGIEESGKLFTAVATSRYDSTTGTCSFTGWGASQS